MQSANKVLKTAFESRLAAYFSACGAWLLGSGVADAEIFYGVVDQDVRKEVGQLNPTLLNAGVFTFALSFGGPGGPNVPCSAFVSTSYDPISQPGAALLAGNGVVAGTDVYGDPINGLKNFQTNSSIDSTDFGDEGTPKTLFLLNSTGDAVAAGDFSSTTPGYIGFRFSQAGTDYYGWVNISAIAADYTSYHVFDWAYQANGITPGAGRPAAAVPEPSSLALLAMGAGGLTCYRLRRRRNEYVAQPVQTPDCK